MFFVQYKEGGRIQAAAFINCGQAGAFIRDRRKTDVYCQAIPAHKARTMATRQYDGTLGIPFYGMDGFVEVK